MCGSFKKFFFLNVVLEIGRVECLHSFLSVMKKFFFVKFILKYLGGEVSNQSSSLFFWRNFLDFHGVVLWPCGGFFNSFYQCPHPISGEAFCTFNLSFLTSFFLFRNPDFLHTFTQTP